MTQTMFAPPPVATVPVDEAAGGSRRTVLIAGGLAAALVLGGGGYVLLSGGDTTTPSSAPVVHLPRPGANAVVKKVPANVPVPAAKVPATSTVPLGRDPFHTLYIQPVAGAPAGGTAPSTSASTSSGSSSTATAPLTTAPYSLKLLSISGTGSSGRFFTFSVGGVKKVVISGQKFGKYGELVALTWVTGTGGKNVSAVVQVGDDNPTSVKIGESISVQ